MHSPQQALERVNEALADGAKLASNTAGATALAMQLCQYKADDARSLLQRDGWAAHAVSLQRRGCCIPIDGTGGTAAIQLGGGPGADVELAMRFPTCAQSRPS